MSGFHSQLFHASPCLIVIMHMYNYGLLVFIYRIYRYVVKRASLCASSIFTVRDILNVHYILLTDLTIYRLIPENWVIWSLFSFELSVISFEFTLLLFEQFIGPSFESLTSISYHGAHRSRNHYFLRSQYSDGYLECNSDLVSKSWDLWGDQHTWFWQGYPPADRWKYPSSRRKGYWPQLYCLS